jgi:ATP-dependent Lon protease
VLPIGGLKEKILAAKRAGILEVIIPKRNEKDLEDIPKNIRKIVKFHLVEKMDEVLPLALKRVKSKPAGKGPAKKVKKEKKKVVLKAVITKTKAAAKNKKLSKKA